MKISHAVAARLGYFVRPCPVCDKPFSGWEWDRDGYPWIPKPDGDESEGLGVCSWRCAATWWQSKALGVPIVPGAEFRLVVKRP